MPLRLDVFAQHAPRVSGLLHELQSRAQQIPILFDLSIRHVHDRQQSIRMELGQIQCIDAFLAVGMPIDIPCYARDSLAVTMRRRLDVGDPYFDALTRQWLDGTRKVFRELPVHKWQRGVALLPGTDSAHHTQ